MTVIHKVTSDYNTSNCRRECGPYHLLCMHLQQLCPQRTRQHDYIPTLLRSHLQQHSICVQLTATKKLIYLLCTRPSQKGFGCAYGSCQRAVESVLPLPWQLSPAVNPTAQTYEESHTEDGLQSPARKANHVDATAHHASCQVLLSKHSQHSNQTHHCLQEHPR